MRAVLCPRKKHLSVSPLNKLVKPARVESLMPYSEKVKWKITADTIADGVELVRTLAAAG